MNIQVHELRIGNILYHKEDATWYKVSQIESDSNGDKIEVEYCGSLEPITNFLPIEITEELMVRFGFKFNATRSYWKNKNKFRLEGNRTPPYYLSGFFHGSPKYVHQLQNLYFALFRVELEVLSSK